MTKQILNGNIAGWHSQQEKTTTRTHEGKLLGVHIGVYQLVNKIKIKERIK